MLSRLLLFILLVSGILQGSGQVKMLHHDPEMSKSIKQGIQHLYNFEFEKAQVHFEEIRHKYPEHPAYPFSQALLLFTKNFPIKPGHPDYKSFVRHVEECLAKSSKLLEKNEKDPDGVFFSLTANSYMAMMHSFSKEYYQTMSTARKTYSFIKQGFTLSSEFPDFHYTSGLFYYYAEQYPATHPAVKPLMLFFENGSKEKAFRELQLAASKAVYTKQETFILLSYIYIKYENKPDKSLEYSEKFYHQYPGNPFALSRYIEGLVFAQHFTKVKELLPKLYESPLEMSRISAGIFDGMLQEKHFHRLDLAKGLYSKSLQHCAQVKNKTDDLQSFAYLGLGRVFEAEGDKRKATILYKKALEITEYEGIKKECNERLHASR